MAIHIDTIIAEIRNSLKQYDTAGLIDDITLYDTTFKALKKFGNLITSKFQTVLHVEHGKANLPSNFQSLKWAVKCDRGWVETELEQDVLQQSYFWKERTEKNTTWNRCEDCTKEYEEKVIVERIYHRDKETKFFYKAPTKLKLAKHTHKDLYAKDCINIKQNPEYEITINNKTVYTNFSDGEIFIEYYGFEIDEEGKPYIPETDRESLETYISYALKRKIFEDIWLNNDDAGIETKIQFLIGEESRALAMAMLDIKAASLTYKGFLNLEKQNKKRSSTFEYATV